MESRRDKYGTGFTSIHQREAPDRGKHLQWNASRSFRAVASRARGTVLRQACCAAHKVGSHRMVLFVGDSQLQAIYDHLCDSNSRRLLHGKVSTWPAAAETCINSSTLMLMIVAAGKWARHFPSFHSAEVVLGRMPSPAKSNLPMSPTAVIHNFASPHLLHVHPVRPLFDADSAARPRCYPQSTYVCAPSSRVSCLT